MSTAPTPLRPKTTSQADQMVELALEWKLSRRGARVYITVPLGNDVPTTFRLDSSEFRSCLAGEYHAIYQRAPGQSAMRQALNILESKGLREPESDAAPPSPESMPKGGEAQTRTLLQLAQEAGIKPARNDVGQLGLEDRGHFIRLSDAEARERLVRLFVEQGWTAPIPAAVKRALDTLSSQAGPAAEHNVRTVNLDVDQQAELLVRLAQQTVAEWLRALDRTPMVTYATERGHRTVELRGAQAREWLCSLFTSRGTLVPAPSALDLAIETLATLIPDSPPRTVYVRVAPGEGDAICIDLADDTGRAIAVDTDGYRIVERPTVAFRQPPSMLPLPEPQAGGDIRALLPRLDFTSHQLVLGWLVMALWPTGDYPVLILHGEQDAGKSTAARMLRALCDPNAAPLRSAPGDERDLMIAARNSRVLVLDNLSSIPRWLSDALCRLSTGGGFATRKLYSDSDEMIIDAWQPVMLMGIDELAREPDLLDRSILIELPPIGDENRPDRRELWRDFEAQLPLLLGALLELLSAVLRELPNVQLERLPRMADFTRIGEAIGLELGWEAGSFLAAYEANRARAIRLSLEASPLTAPIYKLLRDHEGAWIGTARQLLDALRLLATDEEKHHHAWPADPAVLSKRVRRLKPVLRKVGIDMDSREQGHDNRRVIELRRLVERPGLEPA